MFIDLGEKTSTFELQHKTSRAEQIWAKIQVLLRYNIKLLRAKHVEKPVFKSFHQYPQNEIKFNIQCIWGYFSLSQFSYILHMVGFRRGGMLRSRKSKAPNTFFRSQFKIKKPTTITNILKSYPHSPLPLSLNKIQKGRGLFHPPPTAPKRPLSPTQKVDFSSNCDLLSSTFSSFQANTKNDFERVLIFSGISSNFPREKT